MGTESGLGVLTQWLRDNPLPPERLRTDTWAAQIAVQFERDGGVPAMQWPWFRVWRRQQIAAMRRWTRRGRE